MYGRAFSADEACDVGFEAGSPATDDYQKGGTKFSAEGQCAEMGVDKDAGGLDHLISPQDRLRIAIGNSPGTS